MFACDLKAMKLHPLHIFWKGPEFHVRIENEHKLYGISLSVTTASATDDTENHQVPARVDPLRHQPG